jgi:DNA-directed RNA polymerase specialized sigma24 family protein
LPVEVPDDVSLFLAARPDKAFAADGWVTARACLLKQMKHIWSPGGFHWAMDSSPAAGHPPSFDGFIETVRTRLRPVLWSKWGIEAGSDLCAEVEEYAWTHHERLLAMSNPLGYLYRVAQSRARRYTLWSRRAHFPSEFPDLVDDDPELHDVLEMLAGLNENQRACVLLVHGFNWTYDEVAELLGMSRAAVNNHVHRGLTRLRATTLPSPPAVSAVDPIDDHSINAAIDEFECCTAEETAP